MAMSMLRRLTPRKRMVRGAGATLGSSKKPNGGSGGNDSQHDMLPFTLPVVPPDCRFTKAGRGDASTIVLDLDDTLLIRRNFMDSVRLYGFPTSNCGVICPFAEQAVNELSETYRIVAVTARFKACAGNTRRWLEANGLAGMPVMYATRMHPYEHSRASFKAAAIQHLQDDGWDPVVGVGDRPSDLIAYSGRCDLHTLAVCHTVATRGGDPFEHLRRAMRSEAVDPGLVQFIQALPGLPVWRQVLDTLTRTPSL